eukprot:CAMPEP_0178898082 /NCGR_PEP_ID=MMETSP0786-20121207/2125_1 /TAXON_ID=186022 /ORGANISM="Thalassionema frauenfeldii, Strain CCMP 1798" /LENGTH=158 /DNA_ID=CAMNT_0020568745 /DNA_START=257 /DNA_END=730 /DNA_ORIENTATION=+
MATNGVNHAMNADGTAKVQNQPATAYAPAPYMPPPAPAQGDAYTPAPVNAPPPPAPGTDSYAQMNPNPVQPGGYTQTVPAPVGYAPAPAHGAPADAYAPIPHQPQPVTAPGGAPPPAGAHPVPPQTGAPGGAPPPAGAHPVPPQTGAPGGAPPPAGAH